MKQFGILLFFCLSASLLVAQEKVPPWVIIPCDEVPDSIYLQDQIDTDIEEEYMNSGLEHRYTYCIRFQLDSMKWVTDSNNDDYTIVEIPREPDSTEVVDVRIVTYDTINPTITFLSLYALDYGSSIWVNKASMAFGVSIAPMPDGQLGRNFLIDGNLTYGYILQSISPWFGSLNTSNKDSNLTPIKIYPNPTTDLLNIDWTSQESHIQQVEIYDALGRNLRSKQIDFPENTIQVSTENLPNGNYWMIVRNDDGQLLSRAQFQKM